MNDTDSDPDGEMPKEVVDILSKVMETMRSKGYSCSVDANGAVSLGGLVPLEGTDTVLPSPDSTNQAVPDIPVKLIKSILDLITNNKPAGLGKSLAAMKVTVKLKSLLPPLSPVLGIRAVAFSRPLPASPFATPSGAKAMLEPAWQVHKFNDITMRPPRDPVRFTRGDTLLLAVPYGDEGMTSLLGYRVINTSGPEVSDDYKVHCLLEGGVTLLPWAFDGNDSMPDVSSLFLFSTPASSDLQDLLDDPEFQLIQSLFDE